MTVKPNRKTVAAQMEITDLALAPWRAQVLLSLHRLGVFTELCRAARSTSELAADLDLDEPSLDRLLLTGRALGLVEDQDSRWANAPAVNLTLDPDKPGYLGRWLNLAGRWYNTFAGLEQAVRTGRAPEDANSLADPAYRGDFIAGLIDYADYRGRDILGHLDLTGRTRLLDVGCGSAVYSVMLAEAYPDLAVTALDLPDALPLAEERIQASPAANRLATLAHDYHAPEPPPGQWDVILLSHILHQESEADCLALLARCFRALTPGGLIAIQGMFPSPTGAGQAYGRLHDLLTMLIFPGGANHPAETVQGWLGRVGFTDIRLEPMSLHNVNSLVLAGKPNGGSGS